jgi:hypothetical protein
MSRWVIIGACAWFIALGAAGLYLFSGWGERSAPDKPKEQVAVAADTEAANSQKQID